MVFLANEGTLAVGAMTLALVVALAGVFGLGAYVLYCDTKNRLGESEFAGFGEPKAALTSDHHAPLESHALTEVPVEVQAPPPATGALPEPGDPPLTRPRRARPPH